MYKEILNSRADRKIKGIKDRRRDQYLPYLIRLRATMLPMYMHSPIWLTIAIVHEGLLVK